MLMGEICQYLFISISSHSFHIVAYKIYYYQVHAKNKLMINYTFWEKKKKQHYYNFHKFKMEKNMARWSSNRVKQWVKTLTERKKTHQYLVNFYGLNFKFISKFEWLENLPIKHSSAWRLITDIISRKGR